MSSQRFAVIGLDGANLEFIERGAEAGRLPALARVLKEGARAPLESIHSINTVPAWKVMTTGKNPGKLGCFDFVSKRPDSYEQVLFNATLVSDKELWDYTVDTGGRVGVFNVPGTYPPRPVNGVMVSGLMTPSAEVEFTYPADFREEVLRLAGGTYEPDITRPASGDPGEELDIMRRVTDVHARTGAHIIDSLQPDFFMGVLTVTDKVQHHYWHVTDPEHPGYDPALAAQLGDPIMEMYALADSVVGDWLERLGPEVDVLIVSDHGARSMGGMFHVNQWLYEEGLLFPKDEARRQLRRRGVDQIYNLMPEWVKRAARPFTQQALGHHVARSVDAVFDMRRTRAYMLSSGQLYFNVKGRDPQGIVEPGAEYDALAARIRDGLSRVRDPLTDRRLEFEIWQRDDIWHGPYLDRAPDMLIQMSDPFYDKAANLTDHGSPFSFYGQHYTDFVGVHRRMGALLAIGPQIQPGTRLDGANILDVAPTALHVMGLPIPRDMDGQVLTGLLRPDSESARRAPAYQDESMLAGEKDEGFSEDEAAVVAQRLKDLGYFE